MKPKYNPEKADHNVAIETNVYEGLKAMYPYAQLKALVNLILSDHIQQRKKLLRSLNSE